MNPDRSTVPDRPAPEPVGRELDWDLPPGWEQDRSSAQASVTAQGPVALARRPRVTATVEEVPDEDLLPWWTSLEEMLPQALDNYLLLDSGPATVAGLDGVRRLIHYSGRDRVPTVLEQWAAQDGPWRIVVMATLPPRSYDSLIDLIVEMVATARVRQVPGGVG